MNDIKKKFSKKFINALSEEYFVYIDKLNFGKKIHEKIYFSNPGEYERKDYSKEDVLYFNKMLFPCNIDILKYVSENMSTMRDLTFMDNGCGVGILSAFLEKINIKCYNYDKLIHLNENLPTFHKEIKHLIKIQPVSSIVPDNWLDEVNVITISSSLCTEKKFLKFKNLKYIFADRVRFNDGHNFIVPELIEKNNLRLLKQLPETILYGK